MTKKLKRPDALEMLHDCIPNYDVCRLILKSYLDKQDITVLEYVCGGGKLDNIDLYYFARKGYASLLQWAWDRDRVCINRTMLLQEAALHGRLDIIQWLRTKGCPWSASACSYAALNGHLEALKWMRANGCPWGLSICTKGYLFL
jgi:hypothetical protein